MKKRHASSDTHERIAKVRAVYETARRKAYLAYKSRIALTNRAAKKFSRKTEINPLLAKFQLFGSQGKNNCRQTKNYEITCQLPENFSMQTNADAVLQTIGTLCNSSHDTSIRRLNISHRKTKKHDLAAEALLGSAVRSIKFQHQISNSPFQIHGKHPQNETMKRLLRSMGIVKQLEISDQKIDLINQEQEKLRIFEKTTNNIYEEPSLGSPDFNIRTCDSFVDYINKCLGDHQHKLTKNAERDLTSYLGEVLDNILEHSEQNGWSLLGYLDNQADSHICEIVIFNFGTTIAESFDKLDEASYAGRSIKNFLEQHTCYSKTRLNREIALTILALQGRISSKNSEEDDTRGNGTIELIQFFQSLNQNLTSCCPSMFLISGSVQIVFDEKYSLFKLEKRDVISFNQSNSLLMPPDSTAVKRLSSGYFPGTLISIKFSLPQSFYRESQNANSIHNN